MKRVGVKKLKDNLSAYLREVRRGGTVVVTDRGTEIARLTPPAMAAHGDLDARLRRLIDEGKAKAPEVPPDAPLPRRPRIRRLSDREFEELWADTRADKL